MMRTSEGTVKHRVKLLLHECEIFKFSDALSKQIDETPYFGYYSMPSSNGYGEAGIGDFLACVQGEYMEIETKGDNAKHRGIQKAHGQVIKGCMGQYYLVRTEEQFEEFKEIILKAYAKWKEGIDGS